MRQHLILSLIVFMVIIASQGSTASDSPRS